MDIIIERCEQLKKTINDALHEYAALHAIVEACDIVRNSDGDVTFTVNEIVEDLAPFWYDDAVDEMNKDIMRRQISRYVNGE